MIVLRFWFYEGMCVWITLYKLNIIGSQILLYIYMYTQSQVELV